MELLLRGELMARRPLTLVELRTCADGRRESQDKAFGEPRYCLHQTSSTSALNAGDIVRVRGNEPLVKSSDARDVRMPS